MVSVFYHKISLRDTLIINFSNGEATDIQINDKYVIGFDNKKKLLFINAFNISNDIKLTEGYLKLDEVIITYIKSLTKLDLSGYKNDISFIIGHVKKCERINNSHLSVCQVDISVSQLQIVCGASNVTENMKVVIAQIGTTMPNGLFIKTGKLLGYESNGMICSSRELGLIEDTSFNKDGIIKLPDNYQVGSEFKEVYKNLR
jgi:tRNA-binding protein